jgi:hypothetical protein
MEFSPRAGPSLSGLGMSRGIGLIFTKKCNCKAEFNVQQHVFTNISAKEFFLESRSLPSEAAPPQCSFSSYDRTYTSMQTPTCSPNSSTQSCIQHPKNASPTRLKARQSHSLTRYTRQCTMETNEKMNTAVNLVTAMLLVSAWALVCARLFVRMRDRTCGVDDLLMAISLVWMAFSLGP